MCNLNLEKDVSVMQMASPYTLLRYSFPGHSFGCLALSSKRSRRKKVKLPPLFASPSPSSISSISQFSLNSIHHHHHHLPHCHGRLSVNQCSINQHHEVVARGIGSSLRLISTELLSPPSIKMRQQYKPWTRSTALLEEFQSLHCDRQRWRTWLNFLFIYFYGKSLENTTDFMTLCDFVSCNEEVEFILGDL